MKKELKHLPFFCPLSRWSPAEVLMKKELKHVRPVATNFMVVRPKS